MQPSMARLDAFSLCLFLPLPENKVLGPRSTGSSVGACGTANEGGELRDDQRHRRCVAQVTVRAPFHQASARGGSKRSLERPSPAAWRHEARKSARPALWTPAPPMTARLT